MATHTGSNPVLTTMNRAVELITQRNADNGDERPIYSFLQSGGGIGRRLRVGWIVHLKTNEN